MVLRQLVTAGDLRTRVLFTVGLVLLYRFAASWPSPGADSSAVETCLASSPSGSNLGLLNVLAGGGLLQLSIMGLGVMPFITAMITVQLLTVVVPKFAALKREGSTGQAKLNRYARVLTLPLALLQGLGLVVAARVPGALIPGCNLPLLVDDSLVTSAVVVATMLTGAMVAMWFAELITDKGVGNGASVLILAAVLAPVLGSGVAIVQTLGGAVFAFFLAVALVVFAVVTFVELGVRKVPVQYAKRTVASRLVSTSGTYLPFKLNPSNVIPVIFASAVLFVPGLVVQVTGSTSPWAQWVAANLVQPSGWTYTFVFVFLVVFFAFFYASVQLNPDDLARQLRDSNGYVPGLRPGASTALFLRYVLNRLQASGAVYLATVAALPFFAFDALGVTAQVFPFAGVTVLITVSVSLELLKQVQSRSQQGRYEVLLLETPPKSPSSGPGLL